MFWPIETEGMDMQERRSHSFTDAELNDIMDLLAAKRLRATAHVRNLLDDDDEFLIVEDEAGKTSSIKIH